MKRCLFAAVIAGALVLPQTAMSQQSPQVVRIGVIGPLTGDSAYAGQYQLRGAQLHAEQINASQNDIRIEIIAEDDETKCDRAVAAARKLITRDKIHVLLGAWWSTCTLAIVPITKAAQIPQYTVSVAGPITQQNSEWIFRIGLQTGALNRATLQYAVKNLGLKKIAILASNEEVGKSFVRTSEAAIREQGLVPVAIEEFSRGDRDFSGQLGRIRAAGADGIIMATGIQEQAIIVRQINEIGLKARIFGGDAIFGNSKFVELSGRHIEGGIFASVFVPADGEASIKPFVDAYRKKHGDTPDPWAAQFYDAVGLIFAAVKANKNVPDSRQIGAFTRTLKSPEVAYNGVLGKVHFDSTGEGIWSPAIAEVVSSSPPRWKINKR